MVAAAVGAVDDEIGTDFVSCLRNFVGLRPTSLQRLHSMKVEQLHACASFEDFLPRDANRLKKRFPRSPNRSDLKERL